MSRGSWPFKPGQPQLELPRRERLQRRRARNRHRAAMKRLAAVRCARPQSTERPPNADPGTLPDNSPTACVRTPDNPAASLASSQTPGQDPTTKPASALAGPSRQRAPRSRRVRFAPKAELETICFIKVDGLSTSSVAVLYEMKMVEDK